MSTGADCHFTEQEPGRWSYRLQRWPYGDSPDFDTYGPFRSFSAALDHLGDNHANPGGFSATPHPTAHVHEFAVVDTSQQVRVGVEVTVRVESLGPDPSREEVIAFIASLPPDHPAWKVRPATAWRQVRLTRCEACGATR